MRDYLLSTSHPVGRHKAVVFFALGYTPDDWPRLQADLLAMAHSYPASPGQPSSYGQKFEVHGTLSGPNGRRAAVTAVWLLKTGDRHPRFVTAYPR